MPVSIIAKVALSPTGRVVTLYPRNVLRGPVLLRVRRVPRRQTRLKLSRHSSMRSMDCAWVMILNKALSMAAYSRIRLFGLHLKRPQALL